METYISKTDSGIAFQIKALCFIYSTYNNILHLYAAKIVNLNKGSVMMQFLVSEQETVQTF